MLGPLACFKDEKGRLRSKVSVELGSEPQQYHARVRREKEEHGLGSSEA